MKKILGTIIAIVVIVGMFVYFYCKSRPVQLSQEQISNATNVYSNYIDAINNKNEKEFEDYNSAPVSLSETQDFIDGLDNNNKIVSSKFVRAYKKQGDINYVFDNKFTNNKNVKIIVTLEDNKIDESNVFAN